MKRPLVLLLLLFGALLVGPRLFQPETLHDNVILSLNGKTMGTSYSIRLVADQMAADSEQLRDRIDGCLEHINDLMSTYRPASELSRINQTPAHQWFALSPETFGVLKAAQQISKQSDGAFDITVGRLVNLWGFGPTINLQHMPDAKEITRLRSALGHDRLQLRDDPPALLKAGEELALDLSAIAKGYGVDAVAQLLEQLGYHNYMVEIGGEIRTRGHKPGQQPWNIAIERPDVSGRVAQKILHLTTTAMATSGDYRNYFEQDGKRYSHTIDPRTGYPIEHRLASVSVLHDSCMMADGYATALMVLGPDAGMALAEELDLAVYMLVKDGDSFTSRRSSQFDKYLAAQ